MLMLINVEWFKHVVMLHFNTSHVNVNRRIVYLKGGYKQISIHLMLMLIGNETTELDKAGTFQYISC